MGKLELQMKNQTRVETTLTVSRSLIHSLELLAMPSDQIESEIEKKLEENPALCLVTHDKGGRRLHTHLVLENQIVKQLSLYETIIAQAREEFSKADFPIADIIAGSLDEKGYLAISIEEISDMCNVSGFHVEGVLGRVQHLMPIGIGAQNTRDALLIQARHKGYRCAEIVLKDHYQDLLHGKLKKIAFSLEISVEEVREIIDREIKALNPFPGSGFEVTPVITRRPELKIEFEKEEWAVTHGSVDLPPLKIAQDFLKAEGVWEKERVRDAEKFIEAIAKRKSLLIKIALRIASAQSSYLLGDSEMLQPLLISDLAGDLQVSISTVSRAIAGKSIEAPRGVIDLRDLFSQQVNGETSKQKAKMLLKKLIENENQKKPLRDIHLKERLEKDHNVILSRRTISKYRKELNISRCSIRTRLCA